MARAAEVPDVESAPAITAAPGPRRSRAGPGTAVAAGVLVALGVALLAWAAPTPVVGALIALTLVVVAPTAPRVDRRLTLNLALAVGWLPLAAAIPPVLGPRTAGIVPLGLVAGLTTIAVATGRGRVLPRWRRSDTGLVVGGLLAALVAAPLRFAGDPARALAMLSTGIDNAFHFSMYLERRFSSAGSPALSELDTSAFSNYPKGFHSLLAVGAQLLYGDPGPVPVELQRYAGLEWLVFVVVAVLSTSAFLQACPPRAPTAMRVAGLIVLWGLVLGVPGGLNLLQGHLPFLLAAVAILVIVLLTVTPERVSALSLLAAAGLVLTAAAWTLLLPFAGVAVAYPLSIVWRRQRRALRLAVAGLVGVVALGAFAVVLPLVVTGALRELVRDGTIPRISLPVLLVLATAPIALLVVLRRRHGPTIPWLPYASVLVMGVAQLVVLGAYMLLANGALTYYFWKLGLATLLVSLPLTAVLMATAAAGSAEHPTAAHAVNARRRRLTAAVISLGALLGLGVALQEFAAPSAAWAAILPIQLWARPGTVQAGDVQLVLHLARTMPPHEAERTTLLATRPQDMGPGQASAWFHALSLSTSGRAMSTNDAMYDLGEDRADPDLAARATRQALLQPDGRVVVTDAATHDALVWRVGPQDATRITLLPERAP